MAGYVASWSFIAEYCLYVFIAVVGLLQIVASKWQYKGIAFFRRKIGGYAFGSIAIVAAFVWFFTLTGLNLEEPTIDAPPQLLWSSSSVACAILFTLATSSLINRKMNSPAQEGTTDETGLEVLKHKTYWKAIAHYLKRDKTQ